MHASIKFRPIQPDDEAFLYRVYASTREEELAPLNWNEDQKTTFLQMQFFAQHSFYQEQFPDAAFEVILIEGCPAGRLYVHRRQDEISIVDIALLPNFRRRGIGTTILRDLIAEADRVGKPLRIHVERFNPALHLYERLGFSRIDDQGVYYLMERSPASASG